MIRRPSGALIFALLLVTCGPMAAQDVALGADAKTPLAVEDCVAMALENNHNVAIARSNINSSRAAATRAWARVLPTVSASTYWDRLTQGPTEQLTLNERTGEVFSGQTESQAFVSYSMGVNASQTLFSWSAVQGIAQARANVSAMRYSSRATEQDIIYEVKRQFYLLVKAEKLLQVSEESHERSRRQLERAESLFELGSVAKSDVLKAKVVVAQSELDLIAARNVVELERARLAKIMGLGIDETVYVRADLNIGEGRIDVDEMYEMARSQRPEIRAASERISAAKAGLQSAKAGQYPNFFSYFNYRWRDDAFPSSTGDFESGYSWTVGMGLQIPIFDGMVTRGNIGEARAAVTAREREYEDLELGVALELKEAVIALEEARQRIRVSEEQFASAEESYKLAEEQYEVGLGTMLELTEAGVELTTAESQKVEAITDYKVALALLDRASGQAVE